MPRAALHFISVCCCHDDWPVQEALERGRWVAPTPQDIVNSYRGGGGGVKLRAEDIILQVRRVKDGWRWWWRISVRGRQCPHSTACLSRCCSPPS